MNSPRFEGPSDLDRMALRFQQTRVWFSHGTRFRQFLESPEHFEDLHKLRCRSWHQNPLIHAAQCGHKIPIYLN